MAQNRKQARTNEKPMIFGSFNYTLLVIGLLLVTAGFTAMYLENKVSGFISLYISPIVILAGYVAVIFSIMMHSSKDRPVKKHGTN